MRILKLLTARDPEPGEGTVVVTDGGMTYERGSDDHLPAAWVSENGEPETWRTVAGNYGPAGVLRWGRP